MKIKPCYNCGFLDLERECCTCPPYNKWYACPIESEKPENKKALKEFVNWKPEGGEVRRMTEQVYDRYCDTVGNYHWTGVYSGEHVERGGRMSKYVDVDKVLEKYSEDGNWDLHKVLKAEPTADVRENVHGEWLVDSLGAEFCSVCGTHPYSDGEYYISGWESDFCPHCGADMRKGETNE